MAKLPLNELRRIVRIHMNWLTMVTLGKDAITSEEFEELRQYGKLPLESLDLVESSYLLGRLKSFLKSREYKDITFEKLRDEKKAVVYTESERLAIEHARLTAAASLKRIQDEITDGLYSQFAAISGQILTEETIRGVVRDEVVSALESRRSAQELASTLASKLQTNKRDWLKVAKTELHRAKMMGVAQAISNRLGPYSGGDGPDSNVVVIPAAHCCEDCSFHFLDDDGNPRVFKLRDLLAAGSNADPGTSHKKREGLHIHWKPTLPPLHPNCGCVVQYLPPGTGFAAGKMVLKSLTEYQEFITKADSSGVGNPTAKPPGPPQPSKPASPGSAPGVHAPGAGGGTGGGTIKAKGPRGPKGPAVNYVPKDSVDKRPTGTIGETDSSYKVIPGMKAGKAPTEEQKKIMAREKMHESINWSKTTKDDRVKLNHMATGKVAYQQRLGEETDDVQSGVTESYRVVIEGNGRALMKPAQEHNQMVLDGQAITEGAATVPHGRGAHHEAGAYHAHVMFGLHDYVPPTAVREGADGQHSSFQSWMEDYAPVTESAAYKAHQTATGNASRNMVANILAAAPPDKRDGLREKIDNHCVMGIILNHNDAHGGNALLSNDGSDLRFIDNTTTGGTGLHGHKNTLFMHAHNNGMKVKISPKLNERFNKTTFHDMQRSMSGHYSDWQVGQAFLRMRYAQTLNERDGHLNFEYFRPTISSVDGKVTMGRMGMFKDEEFEHRSKLGTLPNNMFESWAKSYIDDVKSNPDHPDHESIKTIDDIGVFMGIDNMAPNPGEYRRQGKHREYEKSITKRKLPMHPDDPVPDVQVKGDIEPDNIAAQYARTTEAPDRPGDKTVRPNKAGDGPRIQRAASTRDESDKTVKPGKLKKGLKLYVSR